MEEITVYVRRGTTDDFRVLTFHRPRNVPARELFDNNIAIDGNSARIDVGPVYEFEMVASNPDVSSFGTVANALLAGAGVSPKKDKKRSHCVGYAMSGESSLSSTLGEALLKCERWLVDFLAKYDYEVVFD